MYSAAQLAKKYFGYYLAASNSKGHGVHSPFVFDFIKFIKNDHRQYDCYGPIETLRHALLKNKNWIEVEDFGAGSTLLKTKRRRIDKMAASSLKPKKFAQLLFRMVQCYQPQTILELGTSFGITTAYLACGNPGSTLYTMEGADSVAAIATGNFEALNLENITLVKGDFTQTLPELLLKTGKIDFAFVDGNHQKIPTVNYFNQLLQKAGPGSILVFDDIHWSSEMEAAWDEIQNHPSVTLTLDLFFIGIVFLSPSFKVKQHFSLRF
jgi:predicted O-methyltransferase YrrM